MILVIGGAGYIGSHMVRLLRESGEPHVVLDNLERGHRAAVQGSRLIVGDLRNRSQLDDVFRSLSKIDVVMHFAAYTYVGESVQDPLAYWHNNTSAVINLLLSMKEHGVRQFVFSSTCATFGEPEYLPLDERHPQRPISPYGQTKLAVERILDDLSQSGEIRSVALRYFNAAGAHPSGEIGEDHRPEAHLIPNAIFAAMGTKPEGLTIFGDDYDTPDGTCLRDYIHVCDLADAHLRAVKYLRDGGASTSFNLGNGNGYSIREVIAAVEAITQRPVPHQLGPRRPGDPARLIGSSEKALRELGWQPEFPSLRTIIDHAWRWHSMHPNGYGNG
ncbi:MAG: UDP-glucose 4-epimerase GalE [Fimbriimonadaceae bacterium]|nr:UDP-glucose 4-epimerase GalE [Fimbriimonadaceae bacterium]